MVLCGEIMQAAGVLCGLSEHTVLNASRAMTIRYLLFHIGNSKHGRTHFLPSRGAMKAYCINLDRRTDRLLHMMRQFSQQGMDVERVAGIDGTLPEIAATASSVAPMASGQRMSFGAFGCFQSHREAWRRIGASGEAYGLVMEDDLSLADGFSVYLQDGWVPSDADLVRLETFLTRTHVDASSRLSAGSRRLQRLRSTHIGAGCYVLNAATARRLYDYTTEIRDPVDVVLFSDASELFAELVTYQMVPAPAAQEQRLRKESGAPDRLTTNIGERLPGQSRQVETLLRRLKRRLVESIRARRIGTRYVVIPFG